jgi:tetratricopeptide (TPR) repeat protein
MTAETARIRMGRNNKTKAGILVLALCCAGCVLGQSTGTTVRHHRVAEEDTSLPPELAQAETAIEKRDYATAEPLLKTVVERDAKNYRGWFDLGFVANATGRTDESIADYRKAVAAKPDVFESNLNLGLTLAKAKQPDAEQFLRAATKLKPTEHAEVSKAAAWMALGRVLEASQPEEALAAYREASLLQTRDPEPHLAAGKLLEATNKFAEAEEEYKKVLAIDGKSAEALIGISNIYMRGHRLTEAAETMRRLVALRPEYAPGHFELARVLAADDKNDEAITELEAGLKIAPGDREAQKNLAQAYTTAGKYEQAQTLYQGLMAVSPNDAGLHYALGQSLMKQRKFAEAQEQFLTTVKLKPDLGAAYGDLAVAANENKNFELAIRALDARAKLLPEIPVSYFLRATAYDHLRQYKQAAENYHLFLQVAEGRFPDQEWQARHRLIAIEPKKR